MAGRLFRGALQLGRQIKLIYLEKAKVDGVRKLSTKAEKFIKPGFDFGHPPFGAHWGIPDVPIGDDGLPLYVDWTQVPGAVMPSQDQDDCGICYIFASLSSISSVNFLKTGESMLLSAQHVIDCNTLSGGDLDGGDPMEVLDFVISNGGILPASSYPFTGVKGICKAIKDPGVSIDAWMHIKPYSEYALKYAVAHQPVVVDLHLTDRIFVNNNWMELSHYKKGIMKGPSYDRPNHVALLAGYGRSVLGKDWKLVNNYGLTWGDKGVFWIERGKRQPGGALGILRNPFVPLKWNPNRIVTSKCESCPNCF